MGQARVVLYFSDYEGFGRPPVEAVLAGAAPVYSSIPATREVMGHCGFPFDNSSYESFAAALRQALVTPPDQIHAWADQLLARHNWKAVANRVLTALNSA
jgi:glycosyltransferase involved in cell wall biosynthesis